MYFPSLLKSRPSKKQYGIKKINNIEEDYYVV